jgi:hypothetical protein
MRELKQNWMDLFNGFKLALCLNKMAYAFVGLVMTALGLWGMTAIGVKYAWTLTIAISTLTIIGLALRALAAVLEKPGALGMGELNLVDPSFCGLPFRLLTVLTMTTSTMFIVWLGDQITLRGIGNGSSVVIMVNICSRLPAAIFEAWQRYFTVGGASIFELLLLLVLGTMWEYRWQRAVCERFPRLRWHAAPEPLAAWAFPVGAVVGAVACIAATATRG